MLGFIGRMLGTPAALDSAVDTGIKAVDKLFYTEQEKAEDGRAARREIASEISKWMAATSGQNLTRRWIALCLFGMWMCCWTALLAVTLGVPVPDPERTTAVLQAAVGELNGPILLVLGFYFAAPHLDKFLAPIQERMLRKSDSSSKKE